MASGPKISVRDLPMNLRQAAPANAAASARFIVQQGQHLNLHETEHRLMMRALDECNGNITKAAEEVGMYRQNFQQKMRELGITTTEMVES